MLDLFFFQEFTSMPILWRQPSDMYTGVSSSPMMSTECFTYDFMSVETLPKWKDMFLPALERVSGHWVSFFWRGGLWLNPFRGVVWWLREGFCLFCPSLLGFSGNRLIVWAWSRLDLNFENGFFFWVNLQWLEGRINELSWWIDVLIEVYWLYQLDCTLRLELYWFLISHGVLPWAFLFLLYIWSAKKNDKFVSFLITRIKIFSLKNVRNLLFLVSIFCLCQNSQSVVACLVLCSWLL